MNGAASDGVASVPPTVVDRFIEIGTWSTSRKTALLAVIATLGDALASLGSWPGQAYSGLTRASAVYWTLMGGAAALALMSVIAVLVARTGREGRWTAYLFVLVYGTFILVLLQVLGLWSTPLMAMYPIAVVVVALWYEERIGWFGFFFGLVTGLAVGGLQLAGLLPYAPAMSVRILDAQNSAWWIWAVMCPMMVFFLFCFVLCLMVMRARRLEAARLRDLSTQLERSHSLIRRYVPAQVAEVITGGEAHLASGHERRKLTLFFSDLVGFTEIAERMEPEDFAATLNEYFTEMTAVAERYDGTVDELMGDAILILFGAPRATNDADHALRAVRMAVDMQAAVERLNAKWGHEGIDAIFRVRMGINTGVVTVGNFGSSGRMKYAALGKHVNVAARLQMMCEPGKVLISHATWLMVRDAIPCEARGEVTLKGIQRPVQVYEPQAASS